MKIIPIPLSFGLTDTIYETKMGFKTADVNSAVLQFTSDSDPVGCVATLSMKNETDNSNRYSLVLEQMAVTVNPFSYTLGDEIGSSGVWIGEITLKKDLVTVCSQEFRFAIGESLQTSIMDVLIQAKSVDEMMVAIQEDVTEHLGKSTTSVAQITSYVNGVVAKLLATDNTRTLQERDRVLAELTRETDYQSWVLAVQTLIDTAVIDSRVQAIIDEYQLTYSQSLVSVSQQLEHIGTSQTIATSSPQTWSETVDVIANTLDGNQNYIETTPIYHRKKVLIYGSSVAYGSGSTGLNSWGNKLKTLLESRGYVVKNHSIGGNTTGTLISRFYYDVAPQKFDFIIISLSLSNEGIGGTEKETVYNTFRNNLKKLISMCKQQGIIPIITNCYVSGGFTDAEYRYIKSMNEELESWDVPVFNFLGGVDDFTGKWITAMQYDPSHPNDVGHLEMFGTIPPSIFDCFNTVNKKYYKTTSLGSLKLLESDLSTLSPLSVNIEDASYSFSIGFKIKNNTGTGGRAFFSFPNGSRLRNPSGPYVFTGGTSEIVSTVDGSVDRLWHHIGFTFEYTTKEIRLYIDGLFIGSSTVIDPLPLNGLVLCGQPSTAGTNAAGCSYRDLTINRGRLNDSQMAKMAAGKIYNSSLELYCPLSDVVNATQRIVNLAPTSSYVKCNSNNFVFIQD